MTETWARIADSSGYEVSDQGRIRGPHGLILRPTDNGHGYLSVGVHGAHRYVHRLVAEAFCGTPKIDQEVRHLDGDKTNNAASNLRWGTRSENIRDQVNHGTHWRATHRQTHCKRGHEFTPENTYEHQGRRHCRRCRADAQYRRMHVVTITEVTE